MRSLLLPAAVFLSAAACLAIELAIVRLGAPHVGQSLLPWTAAITVVLLGLTLGHVLGGRAGGADAPAVRLRRLMALACLCASGATLTMPALAWPLANALSGPDGAGAASTLGLAALCLPPSIAAGFVTPLAIRSEMVSDRPALPARIAAIYAASAAGSIAGTVAAGFWLLERVGATGLAFAAGAVWGLVGLALLPWRSRPRAALACAVAALAPGSLVAIALPAPACTVESRYTCVRYLDATSAQGQRLRFMILDEGVHSASDLDDPRALHLGYAALTDRLAQAAFARSPAPSAMVIGGGGATLPRAWAHAARPASVTVAELDPAVAAEAAGAMDARAPTLRTIIGDGRAILRSQPARPSHDVVLMDAYRTRTVPPHLVTREFGAMVRERLREGGVFLSNVIDRGDTLLLARSLARTLSRDYAAVDIWLAGDADGEGTTNAVVAAWTRADTALRPISIVVPAITMAAGEAPTPATVVWRRLEGESVLRASRGQCAMMLTDDHAPVDRLLAGRAICREGAGS